MRCKKKKERTSAACGVKERKKINWRKIIKWQLKEVLDAKTVVIFQILTHNFIGGI